MARLIFAPDGTCRFIYSDGAARIARALGPLHTRRASHVEPTGDGRWAADLSPVGGPTLGPFDLRADALSAEVEWLKAHDVPIPKGGES